MKMSMVPVTQVCQDGNCDQCPGYGDNPIAHIVIQDAMTCCCPHHWWQRDPMRFRGVMVTMLDAIAETVIAKPPAAAAQGDWEVETVYGVELPPQPPEQAAQHAPGATGGPETASQP